MTTQLLLFDLLRTTIILFFNAVTLFLMAMQIKLIVVLYQGYQNRLYQRYDAMEAINSNKGTEDIPEGLEGTCIIFINATFSNKLSQYSRGRPEILATKKGGLLE